MANRGYAGVTLTEFIVVIIIMGVLATLAFPQFIRSKERAIGREAIANLKLIAAAEKIYRMEAVTGYYPLALPNPQSAIADINSYLRLSITETNWDYAVTGAASTFSSTATRVSGSYSGCTYTIDNSTDEPATATCP